MEKYVENVVRFLKDKFSNDIKNYCYDEETDIYTVRHNIFNLLENLEFQNVVYKYLFDNDIYNVHFEYIPKTEIKESIQLSIKSKKSNLFKIRKENLVEKKEAFILAA